MEPTAKPWDYLIVTASNDAQAEAYSSLLDLRRRLGLLAGVREVLVVADPGGRRVGSGGSTIHCLIEILNREPATRSGAIADRNARLEVLRSLRILIVHAGGDSKRLPAYGPCGKIFVPVPGESDGALGATLFDRQIPTYLALPPGPEGAGQIVIASGDVLLTFDPAEVDFRRPGATGLGCYASPEQAARHGVYCAGNGGDVRRFLQKPSVSAQGEEGAVNHYGQSILDIGVIGFDAEMAAALLDLCECGADPAGRIAWRGPVREAILSHGLDFYREICCSMGSEAGSRGAPGLARASGSAWDETLLLRIHRALRSIPFHVQVLPRCGFLHFGSSPQLISSGLALLSQDRGASQLNIPVTINTRVGPGGSIAGTSAWVEGCSIDAALTLLGENIVVGADIDEPLALERRACLDVIAGRDRGGEPVLFVRCYGIHDDFKAPFDDRAADDRVSFCGMPIAEWLAEVGARPEGLWDERSERRDRSLWNARLFPAVKSPAEFRTWLWMLDPTRASRADREAWASADRYSFEEIARLADQDAFHRRRRRARADEIRGSLRKMFRDGSGFSAGDLAAVFAEVDERTTLALGVLGEAHWYFEAGEGLDAFVFSRILHTLGSAIEKLADGPRALLRDVLPDFEKRLPAARRSWLESLGLGLDGGGAAGEWADRAKAAAFRHFRRAIVASERPGGSLPRSALRSDEIVWGRAPARLDLGGGWTDTPPYALERGGCVINAAVNLNGQPPIQCYARVVPEPMIRIASIDLGLRIEVRSLADLLDYRQAESGFALAKAALAVSGLSPEYAAWPPGIDLPRILELFGGGIELTTLAAIPKGSGLGTSSIMGAVLLAVVERMMGRTLTPRDLFHAVLRLEQELTTGGGWQDQIGGAVDGVKMIAAARGLVPDPSIHYVPADVLDPRENGGRTLLYYTGITRLAKNILQQVVGRYLDRDRAAMETLRKLHRFPPIVADALSHKDLARFGQLIDVAWRLNCDLDPDSTNDAIDALLARIRPHIYGAKLLGAGGGGFLLIVARSPEDARTIRSLLAEDPPNDRARFFEFDISREGLVVTVC